MVGVVTGESWRTEDKEIVLVLSNHENASSALSIDIPDIILGLHFNPSAVETKVQLGERTNHEAINKCDSLLSVVLLLVRFEP